MELEVGEGVEAIDVGAGHHLLDIPRHRLLPHCVELRSCHNVWEILRLLLLFFIFFLFSLLVLLLDSFFVLFLLLLSIHVLHLPHLHPALVHPSELFQVRQVLLRQQRAVLLHHFFEERHVVCRRLHLHREVHTLTKHPENLALVPRWTLCRRKELLDSSLSDDPPHVLLGQRHALRRLGLDAIGDGPCHNPGQSRRGPQLALGRVDKGFDFGGEDEVEPLPLADASHSPRPLREVAEHDVLAQCDDGHGVDAVSHVLTRSVDLVIEDETACG
mmetsp:Transcript_51379/g.111692  ORF Transcript_51379/g.111692 Transcript_51379/m.111692 type:complete len:273 (-) Transcript_51379:30-848(-)